MVVLFIVGCWQANAYKGSFCDSQDIGPGRQWSVQQSSLSLSLVAALRRPAGEAGRNKHQKIFQREAGGSGCKLAWSIETFTTEVNSHICSLEVVCFTNKIDKHSNQRKWKTPRPSTAADFTNKQQLRIRLSKTEQRNQPKVLGQKNWDKIESLFLKCQSSSLWGHCP